MLKPKVGDLVRLRPCVVSAVVEINGHSVIQIRLPSGSIADGGVDDENIESILPRPLAVGDRVRFVDACGDGNILTILAIDGEEAWVKWRSGNRNGQLLSVLRRIDPS